MGTAARYLTQKLTLTRFAVILLTTVLGTSFWSCTTLVGTVKPVDQKDKAYDILDLSKDPKWKKLESSTFSSGDLDASSEAFSSEAADEAYQRTDTGAVISLNSTCRKGKKEVQNLQPFLKELLLGFTHVVSKEDKSLSVAGHEALQRTIQGTISGEKTKIRAIVFARDQCVYDLIYIARPEKFTLHEEDFTAFVASLKLR